MVQEAQSLQTSGLDPRGQHCLPHLFMQQHLGGSQGSLVSKRYYTWIPHILLPVLFCRSSFTFSYQSRSTACHEGEFSYLQFYGHKGPTWPAGSHPCSSVRHSLYPLCDAGRSYGWRTGTKMLEPLNVRAILLVTFIQCTLSCRNPGPGDSFTSDKRVFLALLIWALLFWQHLAIVGTSRYMVTCFCLLSAPHLPGPNRWYIFTNVHHAILRVNMTLFKNPKDL
jgi:hypothetical protein